jgi:hypothetical protein
MGLLDDAIREHLELKRRRGADPTEIERAEREALGPVRRQPEPIQEPAFPEDAALPEEPSVGEEADYSATLVEEHPAAEPPTEHWREEPSPGAVPPEPWSAGAPATPASEEPIEPSAREEPHPPPPSEPSGHLHQETAEYDVGFEHPEAPEPEKRGDDMLEETPEFLQDTPDHDRLWFEQRPPRDFDFDE